MPDSIAIFDRNKVKFHRERAAKQDSVTDYLKQEAVSRIVDRLRDMSRRSNRVADLGAHFAQLAQSLKGAGIVSDCVTTDIAFGYVNRQDMQKRVVMDEELLCFKPASFDLVVSAMSLHWVNDLPGCLAQILTILESNGLFIANMIGGTSLRQFQEIMLEVEMELGGASPRISPFVEVKSLGSLLQRVGFEQVISDSDMLHVTYDSVTGLLTDLALMGERGALVKQGNMLRRGVIEEVDKRYKLRYGDGDGGIIVDFELVTMTGLKAV